MTSVGAKIVIPISPQFIRYRLKDNALAVICKALLKSAPDFLQTSMRRWRPRASSGCILSATKLWPDRPIGSLTHCCRGGHPEGTRLVVGSCSRVAETLSERQARLRRATATCEAGSNPAPSNWEWLTPRGSWATETAATFPRSIKPAMRCACRAATNPSASPPWKAGQRANPWSLLKTVGRANLFGIT